MRKYRAPEIERAEYKDNIRSGRGIYRGFALPLALTAALFVAGCAGIRRAAPVAATPAVEKPRALKQVTAEEGEFEFRSDGKKSTLKAKGATKFAIYELSTEDFDGAFRFSIEEPVGRMSLVVNRDEAEKLLNKYGFAFDFSEEDGNARYRLDAVKNEQGGYTLWVTNIEPEPEAIEELAPEVKEPVIEELAPDANKPAAEDEQE